VHFENIKDEKLRNLVKAFLTFNYEERPRLQQYIPANFPDLIAKLGLEQWFQ